ncbi:MAG: hypothetical protein WA415_13200 [Mycobacterium sp.]
MASDEAVLFPGVPSGVSAEPAYRFLSPHQAAVLDAAAHRLVPEMRDAHVIIYLDRLLSVFRVGPGHLYDGGSLRQRFADVRGQYTNGVALLDQQAGGDFTAVPRLQQQLILSQSQLASFTGLLFSHILDAMGIEDVNGADFRSR